MTRTKDEAEKQRMSKLAELNIEACESTEDNGEDASNLVNELAKPRMARSARITERDMDASRIAEDPSTTMPGTVDKIIPPRLSEPEKAQISIQGPENKYRSLRIENTLHDEDGEDVRLKKGAHVDVTIASKEPRS
jgi:uncharacterized protein YfaS (alpha-2-macroglobulin family)